MVSGFRERFATMVRRLQDRYVDRLAAVDGEKAFGSDSWQRVGGGGGLTRVLEAGAVFERAAANVSVVEGEVSEIMASRLGSGARRFFAAGLSSILHPRSPCVPTAHVNVRYIEAGAEHWFGGGGDLTPYYLQEDDARAFHAGLRDVCVRNQGVADYPRFKRQCDDYFWNRHRHEARGVGGIFYDDLRCDRDAGLSLAEDVASTFLDTYVAIVERRRHEPWGENERRWQRLRRGRYVEFNLIYDRGTRFGLETDGRAESILVSMPPSAIWEYAHEPAPGSREAELVDVLREPRDWLP